MRIFLALKGMAMGIAEAIPGISGGTIAFITGIYEELLNTIKAFGPDLIPIFKKEGLTGLWKAINGNFLFNLAIGMVVGIIIGVFGVTHLLETYPVLVWSFFFGLIISSAIYVGKQVDKWTIGEFVSLILGVAIAYFITVAVPAEGSENLGFVFLSGTIAISALMLPGISGSFILLLMGMYVFIANTVKAALKTFAPDQLLVVAVFALGCLVGAMTFSRVLSWTFKNYRNLTLAALTGFMLGSLNKIWPWRVAVDWLKDPNTGEFVLDNEGLKKVILEQNLSPAHYENMTNEPSYVILAVVIMLIGFASVFIIEKLGHKAT